MELNGSSPDAGLKTGIWGRFAELKTRIEGRLRGGFHSRSLRYGLRRKLDKPINMPEAKIPLSVRPLTEADVPFLFPAETSDVSLEERLEIAWRRAFIDKGARGGFVAVDLRNNTPCYVQWLFSPADNSFIQRLGGFPDLKPGEALLENAYTPPAHRGLGIMSAAMARIAEEAAAFGATDVLTFVDQNNIASLKGCERAGFYPDLLHHRVQFGFGLLKRDTFETLSPDDPRRNSRL